MVAKDCSVWIKIFYLSCLLLFSACSLQQQQKAPVYDYYNSYSSKDVYSVQQGDSLYSIAWLYDLDYQDLAKYNNLASPYSIKVGQQLFLQPSNGTKQSLIGEISHIGQPLTIQLHTAVANKNGAKENTSAPKIVTNNPIKNSIAKTNKVVNSPVTPSVAKTNKVANIPVTPSIAKTNKVVNIPVTPSVAKTNKVIVDTVKIDVKETVSSSIKFIWPVSSTVKVTKKYFSKGKRGINIPTKYKAKVVAAAAGDVVYSGTGINGYGNLILIKHSKDILSAYAYNSEVFVKLGDKVKCGQLIAAVGNGPNNTALLHFEIRKKGKAISPFVYLPPQKVMVT